MLNRALHSGLFAVRWVGCDAVYGNDHDFLDGLELPEGGMVFCGNECKRTGIPGISGDVLPRNRKGPSPETPGTVRETGIM